MGSSLKEVSASLREAVRKATAYTVALEREPYAVSGVLIGGDKVLTASHLVGDDGARVVLPDGKTVSATLTGRDTMNDLALLKAAGVQAARPAVGSVEVGDLVVSLKRDTFDGINAALAMVSASGAKLRLGRASVLERYLQIDIDRLTGTTGGPLADGDGAFAGIQVLNRRMGAEVAIPAELALKRAALIEEKGGIPRPYLGVRSQEVPLPQSARDTVGAGQETGLLLVWVEPGKAAEQAGLMVGDIIVGLAGVAVNNHGDLVTVLAEKGAGVKVEVRVLRGGAIRTVSLTIGEA
jgi:S1-C subfamily serine protease